MFEEIRALTEKLVSVASVNSTPGECDIAEAIEAYIRSIPYFQNHPEAVFIRPLKNDPLGRRNVLALLQGTKNGGNPDTILFHGHTDTVGVDDYGPLEPYAFSCEALMEKLREIGDLPEEVRADLESGDWLFGRGATDMKSGDAVFLVLLRHLSEHPEELRGNLLFSFNPVEENRHAGIIETLPLLTELQRTEGLRYLFAINNDYTCPLYPNDPHRYIYTGTVGKLLPCFYIQGRETHVGQCFEGFDASSVMAELLKNINLNPLFCDGYQGEYTLPPSVLYARDLKQFYNVQTAGCAYTYFNYFVHNAPFERILAMLKSAGEQSMRDAQSCFDERYAAFCKTANIQYSPLLQSWSVYTYAELYDAAKARTADLDEQLASLTDALVSGGEDERLIPMQLSRKLLHLANITSPALVLFFAAPYCPHNTLKKGTPAEEVLSAQLEELIAKFGADNGEDYRMLHFFPSLSDSSYLKMDDDDESLRLLLQNFPAYEKLYNLPFETIRRLNISAVNYGTYGKDAHKWTERVYMPYTFGVLPKLLLTTIDSFLK